MVEGGLTLWAPRAPGFPASPAESRLVGDQDLWPGPAAATWQCQWKASCGHVQTVTETRADGSVEGACQGRPPSPAPSPPAAASLKVSPRQSCSPAPAVWKWLWAWGGACPATHTERCRVIASTQDP